MKRFLLVVCAIAILCSYCVSTGGETPSPGGTWTKFSGGPDYPVVYRFYDRETGAYVYIGQDGIAVLSP